MPPLSLLRASPAAPAIAALAGRATRRRRRRNIRALVLATCILASSLAFIDGSVLNVALPAIGRELRRATPPRCSG